MCCLRENILTLRLSVGGRTDARTDGRTHARFTQYSGISSCSLGSTDFLETFNSRPSGPNTALCAPQWPGLTTPLFPPDILHHSVRVRVFYLSFIRTRWNSIHSGGLLECWSRNMHCLDCRWWGGVITLVQGLAIYFALHLPLRRQCDGPRQLLQMGTIIFMIVRAIWKTAGFKWFNAD